MSGRRRARGQSDQNPIKSFQLLTRFKVPLVRTGWAQKNWSRFLRLVKRGPVLVSYLGGTPVVCLSASHFDQLRGGRLRGARLQRRFLLVSHLLRARWGFPEKRTRRQRGSRR